MTDCTCNNFPASLGNVTFGGYVGIGPAVPTSRLHLVGNENPVVLRLHSTAGFGIGRVEFWSDPPGTPVEWRPGFIQSEDLGGFRGMLAFYVNGEGYENRTGAQAVMRIATSGVGIGTDTPLAALDVVGAVRVGGREVINASGQALYA